VETSDLQVLLRSYGESLVALSARSLPAISTEYLLEEPEDLSARGAVHTFRPTYTQPGPNGTRISKVARTWAWRFHFRGKKYQGSDGYMTATEARAAGEARKAEVRAGLEDDWRKLTIAGLHQHASARRVEWDASTAASFDAVWKRLFRHFLPTDNVAAIDDTRLLQFVVARQKEGAARNTIRLDLLRLRAAMNIAHHKRLLPWVPRFPKLKYERREQTVAAVELDQIVAVMPAQYQLFLAAAQEMGWRARSELRTRKWEHVDWGPDRWTCCGRELVADACACGAGRPGWVRLDAKSSKTDTARVFPMTRRLRSILVDARKRADEVQRTSGVITPWVFVRDDGKPIGDYRSAWQDALRRLGIGKLPGRSGPWSSAKAVHDIRRTAVRRMQKDGIALEDRKALVGHASDEAHSLYAEQRDLDAMRAAARRMDQERAGEEETNVVQLDLFRKRG
jgi:hypothetical protein